MKDNIGILTRVRNFIGIITRVRNFRTDRTHWKKSFILIKAKNANANALEFVNEMIPFPYSSWCVLVLVHNDNVYFQALIFI